MIRAQNSSAYVNGAFLVNFNKDRVTSARICYGGINPSFVHATKTEALLIGTDLFSNETLQAALKSLSQELVPNWVLPDASPEYRKNLAISLFYRFILSTCPDNKLREMVKSGGQPIERPLSSGTQSFQTIGNEYPLTEPVAKYEGMVQCSGEAVFMNDMRHQKNELWAAFVTATKVHAKIGSIDATKSLVSFNDFALAI